MPLKALFCKPKPQTGNFVLLEIEDARPNSIFGGGQKHHNEWGRRFDHGYSQLIDWFWALDVNRDVPNFRRSFGGGALQRFSGLLLIGRSQYQNATERERQHWRVEKVSVNSNKITCMTFDEFRDRMNERLRTLRALARSGR